MKKIIPSNILLQCALCLLFVVLCRAQEKDSSSVSEAVQSFLELNQPKIGLLAQMSVYIKDDGNKTELNGAGERLRMFLSGQFANKFKYIIQGNLLENFELLDLKFSYNYKEYLSFDLGRFKAPFGKEILISDSHLPFVRRSYAASYLGPQRQDGVQIRGSYFDKRFSYRAGIFKGEGLIDIPGKISLFVSKVEYKTILSSNSNLTLCGSFAYSSDEDDFFDQYWPSYFINLSGDIRRFFEGGIQFDYDNYSFSGEYITLTGLKYGNPKGFYFDLTKHMSEKVEVLIRFDWLSTLSNASNTIYRSYITGFNWYPEDGLKLQLDFERDQTNEISKVKLLFSYSINTGS